MAIYVYWFILAAVLLGLEMTSGTFYLLVLSIATGVGGVAALSGLGLALQLVLVAVVAIAGTILLRRWKGKSSAEADGQSLDVGQPVRVLQWHEQGRARVHYRGTEWDAELDPPHDTHEGELFIKSMRGSTLVISHLRPA